MTASDGTEFGWRKYHYYVRHRGLEIEYQKPNDRIGVERRARGHEDRRSRGGEQNRSYRPIKGDTEILQNRGEPLSEVLRRSTLAHDGGREPKEHGCERHKVVYNSILQEPLPLDIASGDEESDEDAYPTISALARDL